MTDVVSEEGWDLARGMIAAVAIGFVVLILRVISKLKLRQFNVDDVLMIIAWGATTAATAFLGKSANEGFGSDLTKIPFEHVSLVLKYIAIQIPLVTISTGLARASFILYILKIVGRKPTYQALLWAILVLQLAANIVSAVLPLSICRDARIIWDPTIKTTCGDQTAVVNFSYFSSSVNTASDLFLALFPTILFWNLHLKLRIKISLILLMSLGVLAMVASIIKTTQIDKVPSIVNTGATGGIGLIRWGYTENVIIIITSSVPVVRPLFISSVRKVSSATRSWSHELSAAGRRSKNTSSKSTSRNTWSKGESSATRQDTPAQVDEEAGVGTVGANGVNRANGGHDYGYGYGYGYGNESASEHTEVGVAKGWPEDNPQTGDYRHGHGHGHGYHPSGPSHGYHSSGSGPGHAYYSSSSGTASMAASRPGSQQSGGITKQVAFSVSSEGGFDSH